MKKTIKNVGFAFREAVSVSKWIIPILLLTGVLSTVYSLMDLFLVKYAVDYAMSEGFRMRTLQLCLLAFLLICAGCRGQQFIASHFVNKYEILFRSHTMSVIYQKCAELDLCNFDRSEFYDKLNRAIDESSSRYFTVLMQLFTFFTKSAVLVAVFSVYRDIWLILAVILNVSLWLTYSFLQNKKIFAFNKQESNFFRFVGYTDRVFSDPVYAPEWKISPAAGDLLLKKYAERVGEYSKKANAFYRKYARNELLTTAIPRELILAASSIYVAFLLFRQQITAGDFLVLLGVVSSASDRLSQALGTFPELYQSSLFISDIREILDYPTSLDGDEDRAPVDCFEELRFEKVSFHYSGENAFAVRDLSFSLKRGQIMAIVGLNGAGKSTVVDCITGLRTPDSGRVRLNDRDYGEYRQADIRRLFGIVFQDFQVYELSVAENVLMRRLRSPEDTELVNNALRYAGLEQKISSLENGIDTVISSGSLSGGEQQLLAIARAYAREAPVIIFDEPTSALDVYKTNDFYRKMFRLGEEQGKTIIFTSHKLKFVDQADTVILMEDGAISEMGSHEALMARNGRYAELFRLRAVDFFAEE